MVLNGDAIYGGATDDIMRSTMINACQASLMKDVTKNDKAERVGWLELVYSAVFQHYLAFGLICFHFCDTSC
jgi:hypothetical protein